MSFEQLYSWHNLYASWRKAAKGKRGHACVAAFEHRLEENLLELQSELQVRSWRPGPYASFYVHDPKKRLISAAPFRDRVVHHALCNVIEPSFERSFVNDSYANRVGKGTHAALDRLQQFARRFPYVLSCDIRKFFPSMDHAVLRYPLSMKIDDQRILWLIDQILESGEGIHRSLDTAYFTGDDLFAPLRPRGLPIGNLTSQFWANVYLNPFDHFVKRELRCPAYVRYVDDFHLFSNCREDLWHWRDALIERLGKLRLLIHPGVHPRPVTEGISFLGFIVYPDRRRLKRRKAVHFRRKLKALAESHAGGQLPIDRLTATVQGWVNHVRYGNTVGLRKAVLGSVVVRKA